jgi:hypothetical protein
MRWISTAAIVDGRDSFVRMRNDIATGSSSTRQQYLPDVWDQAGHAALDHLQYAAV